MVSGREYGGQTMAAPLGRVMVCSPGRAGWGSAAIAAGWEDLGYHHPPDLHAAEEQHGRLCRILAEAGAEVVELTAAEGLTLDAVYVRDPSMMTDRGAICLNTGKAARSGEGACHRAFYASQRIPVLGEVVAPGTAEAGDMVWLDPSTLLVGRGSRTNGEGIRQLTAILGPIGVEVIPAPLPYGGGPAVCFHLMSILSIPGERTALVDLELLSVQTVELLRERGFTLIPIDPAERATQAANVLGLGRGIAIAIEENHRTNARLREAGFDLRTLPGGEICQNGSGGPTCLTRPLLQG